MTNYSTYSDKDLAIRLAEKDDSAWLNYFKRDKQLSDNSKTVQKYLSDKASEILFMEGMAERIDSYLYQNYMWEQQLRNSETNIYVAARVQGWWRTITPRKIIEVFLSMNGEKK